MDDYRLFIFDHNGQTTGSAKAISASSDEDAIAQAEALRGSLSDPHFGDFLAFAAA